MTDAGLPATRRALLAALADGPVSGPALAAELDVSRAAVWKQVEALREAGFEIESTGDGYVVTAVDGFNAEAVAFDLEAPFSVEYYDSIGSTNDRARELAGGGVTDVAVVADRQTGGRGRLDRGWSSPSGGIWCSILLRPDVPPERAPAFTLAAAVAVTRACREAGVDARIKWPNDVLVAPRDGDAVAVRGGRKLCGILTEMESAGGRVSWLVVGFGLNANVSPGDLPAAADATSLSAERGSAVDRRALLQRALEEFDALRRDLDAVLPACERLSLTLGRRVRVETTGDPVVGEAVDLEFPGALVVRTDDGRERVSAGDCEHLRPAE